MSSLSFMWLLSSLKTCFLVSLLKHKDWGSGRKGGGVLYSASLWKMKTYYIACLYMNQYWLKESIFLFMINMHSACKHVRWSPVIFNWDKRGLWVMSWIVTKKALCMDCPRLYDEFWEKKSSDGNLDTKSIKILMLRTL